MNTHIVELLKVADAHGIGDPGTEAYMFVIAIGRELRLMDPPPGINKGSKARDAFSDALNRALPRWDAATAETTSVEAV